MNIVATQQVSDRRTFVLATYERSDRHRDGGEWETAEVECRDRGRVREAERVGRTNQLVVMLAHDNAESMVRTRDCGSSLGV
jgi:hypothetical protein